ncbi:MAG: hypothetical protein MHM6MM_001813 [Cercozoa sp. M6MM]
MGNVDPLAQLEGDQPTRKAKPFDFLTQIRTYDLLINGGAKWGAFCCVSMLAHRAIQTRHLDVTWAKVRRSLGLFAIVGFVPGCLIGLNVANRFDNVSSTVSYLAMRRQSRKTDWREFLDRRRNEIDAAKAEGREVDYSRIGPVYFEGEQQAKASLRKLEDQLGISDEPADVE